MKRMRIVFFGTPEFAVASLEALLATEHDVVAVVTAPDKPAGRGQKERPSPVKACALAHQLLVLQPTHLKAHTFVEALKGLAADVHIVVAFRMLPEVVWDMPPEGTYNVHGSLLPDYRGAAPINWAIVNGEKTTGVTTFKLQHTIDTGSILLQRSTPIGIDENAGDLYQRLMKLGAEILVESIQLIAAGKIELHPQPAATTKHAPKINKEDYKIDWNLPASKVHDFIRGMNPFPGAYTEVKLDGQFSAWKIVKTHLTNERRTATGQFRSEGSRLFIGTQTEDLEILAIQPPGKKKLTAADFLNGFRGDVLALVCA
ncbi:MAG: methionyl-tRNA formyltransferase [Cryomorphaceae bacterium]